MYEAPVVVLNQRSPAAGETGAVPDQPVQCYIVKQRNSEQIPFTALHTFSEEQVEWFKAGSALNVVRQKVLDANG